jgi:hypothetical protein
MAAPDEIRPGEVSPGAAAAINAALATGAFTRQQVEAWTDTDHPDVPIQLTSCDTSYTPARCAWKLRAWNAQGQRIDHPNGRTGTVTKSPALLIGNGAVPHPSYPVDTWGRPTRLADDGSGESIGIPLEVEHMCSCAATGSGTGSGGGGTAVVTDCGTFSTVISLTWEDAAGTSGLDGTVIDLEFDGSAWTSGPVTLAGSTTEWTIECVAGEMNLSFTESGAGNRVTFGGAVGGGTFGAVVIPGFSAPSLSVQTTGATCGLTIMEG